MRFVAVARSSCALRHPHPNPLPLAGEGAEPLPSLPFKELPYRCRRIRPFRVVEWQRRIPAAPIMSQTVNSEAAHDYSAFALQVDL